MGSEALTTAGSAVEIRPGVFRPDWSAVTRTAARRALNGRMTSRGGLLDRWSHRLEADEDLVWRTILKLYADRGHPPELSDISAETGVATDRLPMLLRKLQSHDLVGLHPSSGHIKLAYPFTEAATGHRVELKEHILQALCAIDALGVAGMFGADVTVSSPCPQCGKVVCAKTRAEGRALHSVAPTGAVVWYDFANDGSAAISCCPAIQFFCSDEHLQQWLSARTPRRSGISLTVDEALEVGRAIFGPVLVERKPDLRC